jgi:hypothetical protein
MYAPGDIYPRGARERELCARASHPDWLYLGGLLVLDAGAIVFGSSDLVKSSGPYASLVSPALIGVTWGATVGGAWLALPKCSPTWVGEPPREGDVRATWPVALSLALLAGATAPIVYGIAIGSGDLPTEWTTLDREAHIVVAGLAGFGGALLPYLIAPRTWAAAREIEHIRLGSDGRGLFVGYTARF